MQLAGATDDFFGLHGHARTECCKQTSLDQDQAGGEQAGNARPGTHCKPTKTSEAQGPGWGFEAACTQNKYLDAKVPSADSGGKGGNQLLPIGRTLL